MALPGGDTDCEHCEQQWPLRSYWTHRQLIQDSQRRLQKRKTSTSNCHLHLESAVAQTLAGSARASNNRVPSVYAGNSPQTYNPPNPAPPSPSPYRRVHIGCFVNIYYNLRLGLDTPPMDGPTENQVGAYLRRCSAAPPSLTHRLADIRETLGAEAAFESASAVQRRSHVAYKYTTCNRSQRVDRCDAKRPQRHGASAPRGPQT